MKFRADVVAGSMREPLGEAALFDDGARGAVGLPTGNWLACGETLLDESDGCVAGVSDGLKHFHFARVGIAINHAAPGDVVPDGAWVVGELTPDVDEHKGTTLDRTRGAGRWLVVRVGCVGPDRDIWAVLGHETGF